MHLKQLILIGSALVTGLATTLPAAAAETTLAKIKRTGMITLGYRDSSMPFSFLDERKQLLGYSVDLCKHVASDIAKELQIEKLDVRWRPVTAKSRFDELKSGQIDLECGNTTHTLARRADFDFSLMTFVDGAGMLFRSGEMPNSLEGMKGQRIAVVTGTTTERLLDALVLRGTLDVSLVRVEDHDNAVKVLVDKVVTAYAADRTTLVTTTLVLGKGMGFELLNAQLSYEPYGLMMRRDADFRLSVDRSLARLYRSGAVVPLLKHWFSPLGDPGEAIKMMFLLNALPE